MKPYKPRAFRFIELCQFDSSCRRYGIVILRTCPIPFGGGPKPTLET